MSITILKELQAKKIAGKKSLVILIDPDKLMLGEIEECVQKVNTIKPNFIFVGGSTVANNLMDSFVEKLKKHTKIPIVIFPGETGQITNEANAILFLSLLSGDNPEYLIHQQVKAAPILKNMELEVIPTAYILIEGGKETAVQKISKTKPILQKNISKIVDTAIAAEYMGKQLIYLEAGSGAKNSVSTNIIKAVAKNVSVPLIVGGGIRSKEAIEIIYESGADIVVIGTAFENGEFH